ncbi:zinc-alpha-2-glycoprotein-like isoform X1 [Clupea harengus]|uniref:Zinc-alpha-2-glycoprotein-like isoform X1 n=1 Tax=Clupea harengus TaxID=7950 RepID=A0A8M1KGV1_CLUHA|nr:zinc-alpha-2-glycoprotein-like isoform X1 [Clupea harengus]
MGLTIIAVFIGVILPSLNGLPRDPERHSLYYIYTALSKTVTAPNIYEFTAMGLLDDRKIDYYNSVDKKKIPQENWMKEKLAADYWTKGTQSRQSKEQWFKVNVNILMERMKQNESDLHVLSWRHGCEIDKYSDGRAQFVSGVDEYNYDGVNFLSFDENEMQWIAAVSEAVPTKRKWDGVPVLNQYTKGYLEKECVGWLEKFMAYAEEELKQASPPEVYLFARVSKFSSDKLSMTCLATGFHPKDIDMSIQRGQTAVVTAEIKDVFPNGDGTHQVRLQVEVPKLEANDYECFINHKTLNAPVVRFWKTDGVEFDESSPIVPIAAGVGVGVLLLVGVVILVVLLVKRKPADRFSNTGTRTIEATAAPAETETLTRGKADNADEMPEEEKKLNGDDKNSGSSKDSGLDIGHASATGSVKTDGSVNSIPNSETSAGSADPSV